MEEFALRSFFYDWCIPSTNRALSRGYLSGLESMVANLGWQSDLAKACKIVACATHGKKLRRPALLHKGDTMACELLQSLRERIKSEYGAVSDEAAMVAVLLGLHEVFPTFVGLKYVRLTPGRSSWLTRVLPDIEMHMRGA